LEWERTRHAARLSVPRESIRHLDLNGGHSSAFGGEHFVYPDQVSRLGPIRAGVILFLEQRIRRYA
jgi:hypothetical protein